jgi:hypothetical protein
MSPPTRSDHYLHEILLGTHPEWMKLLSPQIGKVKTQRCLAAANSRHPRDAVCHILCSTDFRF